MYNAEQKERFLQEHPEAKSWFDKTESFEEDNGKDLYDFNVPEILEFYKMQFTKSLDRLIVANGLFTKYSNFALQNALVADCQNHFKEIDNRLLAKCLDQNGTNLITRDEMRIITSKLLNPLDKYIFWAMFDGLKGGEYCEITQLKLKDIDMKSKTAKLCTGRTVKLSQELINAAIESYHTNEYYSYMNEDNDRGRDVMIRQMEGDIYKTNIRKNENDDIHILGQRCYRILVRCVKFLGIPAGYFSGKHLWDSGVMDWAENVKNREKISIKEVFYGKYLEELNQQYKFTPQMRSTYMQKYRKYFEE